MGWLKDKKSQVEQLSQLFATQYGVEVLVIFSEQTRRLEVKTTRKHSSVGTFVVELGDSPPTHSYHDFSRMVRQKLADVHRISLSAVAPIQPVATAPKPVIVAKPYKPPKKKKQFKRTSWPTPSWSW